MAPPTAKSKKDEEKTHKSAISDALVTKEHGDELTGLGEDQRPKTIPPVLGNNP
ncbi:MAG: hypothetical protein J2P18_11655 [Nocardia sp.]|nr:hypothetical protein [Nocardia sp.]